MENNKPKPYMFDNLLEIVYIYDEYEDQYETECNRKLPSILVASYPFLFTPIDDYVSSIDVTHDLADDNATRYRKKIKGMYARIDYLNMFNKKRHKIENADELYNLRKLIKLYEIKLHKYLTKG